MFADIASVCILQLFPLATISHSFSHCKKKRAKFDKSRGVFAKNDELCVAVINRIYSPPSHQHDLIAMCQTIKQYKCVKFKYSQAGHIHIGSFLAVVILWKIVIKEELCFLFLKHCMCTGSGRLKNIFFVYF